MGAHPEGTNIAGNVGILQEADRSSLIVVSLNGGFTTLGLTKHLDGLGISKFVQVHAGL